jgi:SAM-dependent methyltransferase
VRSVLDIGCGEGTWQGVVRRLRPSARYLGVDPSDYAVDRFGSRRNLRKARLDQLGSLDLDPSYDLMVCIDVLPYVTAIEVRRGLDTMAEHLGGVALVEIFTAADDFEGDLEGYRARAAATYERWFDAAGLVRVGPNLFVTRGFDAELAAFERA